jgi:hypothetical protein
MKWTHLPVAGGVFDQSPRLIDHFESIMAVEARVVKRQQAEQERKAKKSRMSGRGF